jgi:hypothetical protein
MLLTIYSSFIGLFVISSGILDVMDSCRVQD